MERGAAHEGTRPEQPVSDERAGAGLEFQRFFTLPGVDPFDEITWEQRSAIIGNERGEVVFEQRDVEIPFWPIPSEPTANGRARPDSLC